MSAAPEPVRVIVYGQQGCGKTRAAERIRAWFGAHSVVDDWFPGDPIVPGAIHLTHSTPPEGARRWVSFASLPASVRLG